MLSEERELGRAVEVDLQPRTRAVVLVQAIKHSTQLMALEEEQEVMSQVELPQPVLCMEGAECLIQVRLLLVARA